MLFAHDGRRRLKRDPKINILAIADPALHASGVVCDRTNLFASHFKGVIVLRAAHPCRRKTRANLKTFRRRYAEHRFRQVRFELIENWFANSWRDTARDTFDYAAD